MWTGRLTEKNDTAGADDIASLRFNSGLEHPPHPGASETASKIRILFLINNLRGIIPFHSPPPQPEGRERKRRGEAEERTSMSSLCSRRTGTVRAGRPVAAGPYPWSREGCRLRCSLPVLRMDGVAVKGKAKAGFPARYRPPEKRIILFPRQALPEGHSHARTAHPRLRLRRPPGILWPPGAPPSGRWYAHP